MLPPPPPPPPPPHLGHGPHKKKVCVLISPPPPLPLGKEMLYLYFSLVDMRALVQHVDHDLELIMMGYICPPPPPPPGENYYKISHKTGLFCPTWKSCDLTTFVLCTVKNYSDKLYGWEHASN